MIKQLLGWALICYGIFTLGEKIIFTSYSPYWWSFISAKSAAVLMFLGVISTTLTSSKSFGWGLIALSILLILASGRLVIEPISLFKFFVGFVSIGLGLRLSMGKDIDI